MTNAMLRLASDGLPEGWFSLSEVTALRVALKDVHRGRIVEIGAWYGRSTAVLAELCRVSGSSLVVIDTWRGSPSDLTGQLASSGPDPFEVFKANLTHCGLWDLIEPRRLASEEAALTFENDCLDAILLDADHSYDAVCRDRANWWPKLKPGGRFLGHDFRPEYPGVQRAVHEFAGRLQLATPVVVDSLWELKKPTENALPSELRVAVVTPTYRTPAGWLERCCNSVAEQTVRAKHYIIADGGVNVNAESRFGEQIVNIPGPARDYGDTPRAIGSFLAISQGCDYLAWLDADNWFAPDYLEEMIRLQLRSGADIVTSGRTLYTLNEERLGPCYEVDGRSFVDTNCYLLTRKAFFLAGLWGTMPPALHKIGDRVFWERVRRSGLRRAHRPIPSVGYRTAFRCHYEAFHRPPPADAKEKISISAGEQRVFEDFVSEGRSVPRASAVHAGNENSRCVVIVPHQGNIQGETEAALRELEARGYVVWRRAGYSAIDQGRCQLATDALVEGFEETMWIDSDIGFKPDDVDRLRAHQIPISCGLYAQKSRQAIAGFLKEGTPEIVFGEGGGLVEMRYMGAGFLHVRREVYETIELKLKLPVCNLRFGRKLLPYFLPLVIHERWQHAEGDSKIDEPPPASNWYLAEDFAFCERARRCGYKIMADSTIRLMHFGNYGYSWEDAGGTMPRYSSFQFKVSRD